MNRSSFAACLLPLIVPSFGAAQDFDAGTPDASTALVLTGGLDASLPAVDPGVVAGAVDVTVRGGSERPAERAMNSAEAVYVVDLKRARTQSVDLGEVLARTQGVGVRRQGGLGSDAIISLNGLQNEQVRLFLDGVPLERAGYPLGIANVPVNLVDRVEIYRGVVPVRLGTDALGGAIQLVTDPSYETHVAGSFQSGSYGMYRTSLNGRYRHEKTGIVAGAAAFVDSANNSYYVDNRQLMTPEGGSITKSVRRFNDEYRAYGGNVELGIVDKRWARRLVLQGFASTFDKGIQNNMIMSLVYGEATRGQDSYGSTARYEVDLSDTVSLESFVNYSRRRIDFQDLSTYRYDWSGNRVGMVGRAGQRGEIGSDPNDSSLFEDSVIGKLNVNWKPVPMHALHVSVTPIYVSRRGDNHLPVTLDNLRLRNDILQITSGAEYELNALDDKLQNIVFAKAYYLNVNHEYRNEGSPILTVHEQRRKMRNWGAGDQLRYRFDERFMLKASYEYTTRLPTPDELFGDGVLIEDSAQLRPEQSHNVNLGPRMTLKRTRGGDFTLDINAFLRETKDQIILLATATGGRHRNVTNMRGRGIEYALSWSSPQRWFPERGPRLSIDASQTYLDLRNTSTEGVLAALKGERIPNRPWLFASWGARLRFSDLPRNSDTLEPFYIGRYTHQFLRLWEIGTNLGDHDIAWQLNHDVGVTYTMLRDLGSISATFEVDNVTDARLFDLFGVQRPGRSFNFKLSGQI